tara:strand:- start:120 stop:698 length:579 start_codon:yes stop_codon:yes gene_type:complete
METSWIMTAEDEFDYNDLSVDDKNKIFDDLNTLIYRFDKKETRTNKASFSHRWKPESAVAYKLMVRTHQKVFKSFRIPNEQLTELQIKLNRVWNGEKMLGFCDDTHKATEEIEELYNNLLNDKDHVTEEYHYEKMTEIRKEHKEEMNDKDRHISLLKDAVQKKERDVEIAHKLYQDFKRDFWDKLENDSEKK